MSFDKCTLIVNVSLSNIKSEIETMLRRWGDLKDNQDIINMKIGNLNQEIVPIELKLKDEEVQVTKFK